MKAAIDLEKQVLETRWVEALVLRFGWLYGPGTWFAPDGSIGRAVRRRMYPIVGEGRGTWSFLHVEDAASALVAATDHGPPGIYNIVDDAPAPIHIWLPEFARALGAPKPLRAPRWLALILAGAGGTQLAEELAGASNRKAKESLGWNPRFACWREGFTSVGLDRSEST